MDTEKLKPFNEFNSEKSAMVNEICYRLFQETEQKPEQKPEQGIIKELKKVKIPTQINGGSQVNVVIGTAAEYGNKGVVPVLVETGSSTLSFGKYTDSVGARLVIRNTSTTALSTSGVLYLLIMEVK